jgi:flagellar biogenesis protein FliO
LEGIKLVLQLVFGLVLFAGILYLSYAATKYLAKRLSPDGRSGHNMKIIESLAIGKDSCLLIVKAGEKILLLGKTAGSISLVSELSADEIATAQETSAQSGQQMTFAEALKINIAKRMGKEDKVNSFEEEKDDKKENS